MKTQRSLVFLSLLLFTFCSGALIFEDASAAQRNRKGKGIGVISISDAEKATMVYIREEEKLARDVYIKMFESWGAPIFSNISVSEQRHMDAVLNLLVKYGIPDPASGKEVGDFTDTELQKLYIDLISLGQNSLLDAFLVGRAIEEMDINDLQTAIGETDKADLERVYDNLLNGSFNHLNAFNSHIENVTQ